MNGDESSFGLWTNWFCAGRPVGERMPLALDTRVVCVERLSDANDVQARLVGHFSNQFCNLLWCFIGDELCLHITIDCVDKMEEVI